MADRKRWRARVSLTHQWNDSTLESWVAGEEIDDLHSTAERKAWAVVASGARLIEEIPEPEPARSGR